MVELTDIQGIGPATAESLGEEGINSVEDLAEADAETVERAKNVTESNAQMFIVRAQEITGEADEDSVDEEDLPEEDDVSDEVTADLFPDSPSDEEEAVESEEVAPESEEDPTEQEVNDEDDTENVFDVELDLNGRQYDLLMYSSVNEFIKEQHRNRERAAHMDEILEDIRFLEGSGNLTLRLSREELNTLFSAVRATRRNLQGKNRLDLMREMDGVEDQVSEARQQLF